MRREISPSSQMRKRRLRHHLAAKWRGQNWNLVLGPTFVKTSHMIDAWQAVLLCLLSVFFSIVAMVTVMIMKTTAAVVQYLLGRMF